MSILVNFNNLWHWIPYFKIQFDDYQEQLKWYQRDISVSFGWGPFAIIAMTYSYMCVHNSLIEMVDCLVDHDEDKHTRLMSLLDNPKPNKYTYEEFNRAILNIRDN